MIGQQISRYKILEKLGEGGMGEVYLAEDSQLHRKVAMKFLPARYIKDPSLNIRFKQEAKSAASLNHANIITIYDIGEYDGKPFIAMEYLPGKSLKDLLENEELPLKKIIDITAQICAGLHEAHRRGVFHRDIKADNILIDADGNAKIADFGLARARGSTRITEAGSTMGTLDYMSPEQLSGVDVDKRSDIWSLGVLLFRMLTGRLPFAGEYDATVSYRILNEEPEPLARYKSGVSGELQRIVSKTLDKEVETRYQNVEDLLTDLKREKKSSTAIKRSAPFKNKRKINRYLRFSISAAIVLLIAIIVITQLTENTGPPITPKKRQLTFNGTIFPLTAALSPDGQFLVYGQNKGSSISLMVRDLFGGQPIEIMSNFKTLMGLRWSPDGSKIICYGMQVGEDLDPGGYPGKNYIIPRLGGKARIMSPAPWTCWSPDGSQIAGTWTAGIWQEFHPLWFFDTSTGDTVNEIRLPATKFFSALDWSPGGNKLLFLTTDENMYTIWTINTDGSSLEKVVEEENVLLSPRWSKDGNSIYYLKNSQSMRDLIKIGVSDQSGKPATEPYTVYADLQSTDVFLSNFELSADNRKISYINTITLKNIWLESTDLVNLELKMPKKLTSGTSEFSWPAFSPDGKKIAFTNRGQIYVMDAAGGEMQQLTFLDAEVNSPAWRPDGKKLAFIAEGKVWTIPTTGGPAHCFRETEAGFGLVWSPEGKILYRRTGNRNFNLLDTGTEMEKAFFANDSTGFVFYPCFSPDGKYLALSWNRYSSEKLWIVSTRDKSEICLQNSEPDEALIPMQWSADGRWIYARKFSDARVIKRISVPDGFISEYWKLSIEEPDHVSITPDGMKIVCSVPESYSDVWLMENFDPEAAVANE